MRCRGRPRTPFGGHTADRTPNPPGSRRRTRRTRDALPSHRSSDSRRGRLTAPPRTDCTRSRRPSPMCRRAPRRSRRRHRVPRRPRAPAGRGCSHLLNRRRGRHANRDVYVLLSVGRSPTHWRVYALYGDVVGRSVGGEVRTERVAHHLAFRGVEVFDRGNEVVVRAERDFRHCNWLHH